MSLAFEVTNSAPGISARLVEAPRFPEALAELLPHSAEADALLSACSGESINVRADSSPGILLCSLHLAFEQGRLRLGLDLYRQIKRHMPLNDAGQIALLELLGARLALYAGELAEAEKAINAAVSSLKTSRNRHQLSLALLVQGQVFNAQARSDDALSSLHAALHIVEWELRSVPDALHVRNLLAVVHKLRGKWTVAEDLLEQSLRIASARGLGRFQCLLESNLAVLRAKRGDLDSARTLLESAMPRARNLGIHHIHANTVLCRATIERIGGAYLTARRNARAVLKWAIRHNQARTEILAQEYLGDVRLDEGQSESSLECLDKALQLSRSKYPGTDLICEVQRRRAEALAKLNRVSEALRAAEEAISVSKDVGDPYEAALALRAKGMALRANGDVSEAARHFEECETRLSRLGEKFELGRTLLAHAEIGMNAGSYSAGLALIERARTIFREMGAANWVQRANDCLLNTAARPQVDVSEGHSASTGPSPARFGIITQDETVNRLFSDLAKIADSDISVLVTGESGTGKDLFANALHRMSPRVGGPFIPVNCGSIPKEMQEAELFGHRRGAFTGAVDDNPGLFEAADKGTLFLDEIGEMAPQAQVKLLRAIELGEVRRVGERRLRTVDVRFVSATNCNIEKAIQKGQFRQDLFYRLDGLTLHIPPLRERRGDVPLLIDYFLDEVCTRKKKSVTIGPALRNLLVAYNWPGNVRELKSRVEQAVQLADDGTELTPRFFPFLNGAAPLATDRTLTDDMQDIERQRIVDALKATSWVKADAARLLKITRTTLCSRMERLGIPLSSPARLRPPR